MLKKSLEGGSRQITLVQIRVSNPNGLAYHNFTPLLPKRLASRPPSPIINQPHCIPTPCTPHYSNQHGGHRDGCRSAGAALYQRFETQRSQYPLRRNCCALHRRVDHSRHQYPRRDNTPMRERDGYKGMLRGCKGEIEEIWILRWKARERC